MNVIASHSAASSARAAWSVHDGSAVSAYARAPAATVRILREGRNCWCLPRASRAAVVVDGAAYFAVLADALERAERSVLMLGWDFHSRVRLRRGGGDDADSELLAVLERQVRRRRALRVRILAWNFPMFYALEREWHPRSRFGAKSHRHISFHFDSAHPLGASQHQKLVIIDDALAFSGGLDVTACRWDTREHRQADALRCDPSFEEYEAFHDVQIAVDGDAALALGELARERWARATGRHLAPVRERGDPWPSGLRPDFRNVGVAISRTFPAYNGRDEVREVEALFLDAIGAAESSIYLENQYLSSHAIGEALSRRLEDPEGPEVVILLPNRFSGWLEERTMGVMAARVTGRLRAADRFRRLRLLRPELPGGEPLNIHSKVMVIDDRLLRVGSANASNRSMGLDSECDLSIEATPAQDVRREIRAVRDDLLAEQLGTTAAAVADAIRREGSLARAIDALAVNPRRLVNLDLPHAGWIEEIVPEGTLFDPERPVALEDLWALFGQDRENGARLGARPGRRAALGLAAALAVLAAWHWAPLAGWLEPEALARSVAWLGETPAGVALCVVGFAIATSLLVPVTALIACSGMLFGVAAGSLVGLAGSLLAAGIGHVAGGLLWRDGVREIAGARFDRISRRLGERGVLAAAAIRLVPIAPFGVVNLAAGASHIRLRDFLIGTLLGMAPGTALLAYFGDRASAWLQGAQLASALAAAAALLAIAVVGRWVGRRLG